MVNQVAIPRLFSKHDSDVNNRILKMAALPFAPAIISASVTMAVKANGSDGWVGTPVDLFAVKYLNQRSWLGSGAPFICRAMI